MNVGSSGRGGDEAPLAAYQAFALADLRSGSLPPTTECSDSSTRRRHARGGQDSGARTEPDTEDTTDYSSSGCSSCKPLDSLRLSYFKINSSRAGCTPLRGCLRLTCRITTFCSRTRNRRWQTCRASFKLRPPSHEPQSCRRRRLRPCSRLHSRCCSARSPSFSRATSAAA